MGNVQEVVLVHEDITARRNTESALRDSEERLRLALEAGTMGRLGLERMHWRT